MILYYDNYIIDSPLYPSSVKSIKYVRESDTPYKQSKKLDTAKYALNSYKVFPWSKVIIKIDAEKESDKYDFIVYAKTIFPDAEIIPHRSDNQKEYCKTIDEICKLNDEWIFYTPNNDIPLIASDISHISKLIEKAIAFKKTYQYVSIVFSMFSEYYNYNIVFKNTYMIENSNIAFTIINPTGDTNSIQIVHRDLLKHWFCSKDLGNIRIIRAEDISPFLSTSNQLIIIPKKEICAHFDGYSHTVWVPTYIREDQIPPLFIPPGFFENNIKIAYGYNDYKDGYVNINPSAKYYSFKNKENGTDLKISLQDIPLFWKDKIKVIDINPKADLKYLSKKRDEYYDILYNPWKSLINRLYLMIRSELYWFPRKINNLIERII